VFISSTEEDGLAKRFEGGPEGPVPTDNTGRRFRTDGARIEGTVAGALKRF